MKGGKTKLTAADGHAAQRLGRFGQSQFEAWGAQADFTTHRANPDIDGWDYFVEIYEPDAKRTPPFDEIAAIQSCKVQVKTIPQDRGHCSIELSTVKRMTDPNAPWFVLIIVSSDRSTVERAYLLHIDGARLGQILKRLYKHPKGRPLNKSLISFSWKETDALSEPFASSFLDKVKVTIGDQKKYIDTKYDLAAKVGYEKAPYKGSVTIKAESPSQAFEIMSLFAVGLTDKLDLTGYTVHELRFGVSKPVRDVSAAQRPAWSFRDGRPPAVSAQLTIANDFDTVTLSTDFYSTRGLFPFLPADHVKYRFVAGPLSLILLPDARISMSFDANPDKKWSVDLLGRVGKAIRLLHDKGASFQVMLEGGTQSPPMRIKDARSLTPDFTSALALCEAAKDLVYRSGELADLKICMQDVVDHQQELRFVAAAVNPMFRIESFALGPDSVATAHDQVGKELDAFVCPFVTIGGKTIAPIIALQGVASVDAETGQTQVERPAVQLIKMKILESSKSAESWWSSEQQTLKGRPGAEVAYIMPPYA